MAFNWGQFGGSLLSGVGQGLMQAGTPGGNFGQGFMAGTQGFQQQLDAREMHKYREIQAQALQQQMQDSALAHSEKAAQDKAWQDYLASQGGGGMMSTAPMMADRDRLAPAQPGVQTAAAGVGPGMMSGQWTPEQWALLHALPREQGMAIMAQQAFAPPKEPKDNRTDDQREYEFARSQGYEGSFLNFVLDQKKAGASSTTVDVHAPNQPTIGAIPPGYVAIPDGNGKYVFEKIPGGPAADEQADKDKKAASSAGQKQQMSDIVTGDIQRALDIISRSPNTTTGIGGQVLSNVGGTASNDVRALVQTVRANVGFDQLQQMRANSPTGGALGPVSDAENGLLQSVLGNLEQSQSQEQLERNLKRLNDVILDIVHGPGKGGQRYGQSNQGAGDLKSKYGLE